mmetsp:Transcript_138071/g.441098  ORF Transcript_138071/g.441098 Transcript_138071/m.441098 type:complete len:201 (+) Transcript_138071:101-703(+)
MLRGNKHVGQASFQEHHALQPNKKNQGRTQKSLRESMTVLSPLNPACDQMEHTDVRDVASGTSESRTSLLGSSRFPNMACAAASTSTTSSSAASLPTFSRTVVSAPPRRREISCATDARLPASARSKLNAGGFPLPKPSIFNSLAPACELVEASSSPEVAASAALRRCRAAVATCAAARHSSAGPKSFCDNATKDSSKWA